MGVEKFLWERLPILFPKTSEAFYNLDQADFSWDLCPENKCMIDVAKNLQRGSVIIFLEWP